MPLRPSRRGFDSWRSSSIARELCNCGNRLAPPASPATRLTARNFGADQRPMTVFPGLTASGPDRNTPIIRGHVEPICTFDSDMTRFVISTEHGGCMVISEANPFRVNIPYGTQSSHLPPSPTGTRLLGVPAQLVCCPSVTPTSRGMCCFTPCAPLIRCGKWFRDERSLARRLSATTDAFCHRPRCRSG